jgi:tetratricopeptide (TPR) repeat protein
MKNNGALKVLVFVACALILKACAVVPQSTQVYKGSSNQQIGNDMTAVSKKLESILKTTFVYNPGASFVSVPKQVEVSDTQFKVINKSKVITISIPEINEVAVIDWGGHGSLSRSGHYRYSMELQKTLFSWSDFNTAQSFADAIYFMRQKYLSAKSNDDFARFELVASEYRALKVKPAVPEEQRKYLVQANSMTQMRNYVEAIKLYDKAIAMYQTNPAVYYNQALLFAQIKQYDSAINRMKKYLMLVPNAADARSAQDKIYEWEILVQK